MFIDWSLSSQASWNICACLFSYVRWISRRAILLDYIATRERSFWDAHPWESCTFCLLTF